jgi:hypothetical protein
VKPSIRKQGNQWTLTRPPYGFAQAAEVTTHESWKAARQALLGDAPGSAGPSNERAYTTYTPGLSAGWGMAFRPRWIEMGGPRR